MAPQTCYCINPNCPKPGDPGNNIPTNKFCIKCGFPLLLNNKYRSSRLLSSNSGFGLVFEVFSGFDVKILKVLKPDWNQTPQVINLFKREYDVLDQLTKQNVKGIPQSEDYFIYNHTLANGNTLQLYCLVMEKVEGIDLEHWVDQYGQISQKQALLWLKETVLILDKIHQKDWFHRDIKPPNIMMRNNGQLVLIDFGTARELTGTYQMNLQNQHITGVVSQGYTPNEQINSSAEKRSDFFALGRTFVHLLTGQHPLSMYDPDNDQLNWRDRTEDIDPPLLDFIDHLMQRLPKDRPPNTQVILQMLAQVEQDIILLQQQNKQLLPQLKLQVQQQQQELLYLQSQLQQSQPRIYQLEQEINQKQRELQQQQSQSQSEISRLQSEISQLQSQLRQQSQSQSRISQLEQEINEKKQEIKRLEKQLRQQPGSSQPRRKFLQSLGLFGGGLISGVFLSLFKDQLFSFLKPKKSDIVKSNPNLNPVDTSKVGKTGTFSFKTVTVNDRGEIITTQDHTAENWVFDLGNGVLLEMVKIPGDTFTMGSPPDEKDRSNDEGPQHPVTIADFYMGRYPVTQAQYQQIMGENPSSFKKGGNYPVENVTWHKCKEFCQKLSQKLGINFSLPSEAQWEYACRAGTKTPFHFGPTITTKLANYDGRSTYANEPTGIYLQETTPVDKYPYPNKFGLYDMHGNVWEWCEDDYHENYNNAPVNGEAWLINKSQYSDKAIIRGGSWNYVPYYCRSAGRVKRWRDDWFDGQGFRLGCLL